MTVGSDRRMALLGALRWTFDEPVTALELAEHLEIAADKRESFSSLLNREVNAGRIERIPPKMPRYRITKAGRDYLRGGS